MRDDAELRDRIRRLANVPTPSPKLAVVSRRSRTLLVRRMAVVALVAAGDVSGAGYDALGRLLVATDAGVYDDGGTIAGGGSWGLDRIDQRNTPIGQDAATDTSFDLFI